MVGCRRYMHGGRERIDKGVVRSRNGEREGVSTVAEEEVAAGGGKHRREEVVVVVVVARASERASADGGKGGKGLFESIDEADGATCLRSTPPLHTPILLRVLFLPPRLCRSPVVADVTRRYILLNE